jgi:hypothetical protein
MNERGRKVQETEHMLSAHKYWPRVNNHDFWRCLSAYHGTFFNRLMPFAPQITPAHATNLKQRDPEVMCRKRNLPAEFETLQSCLR